MTKEAVSNATREAIAHLGSGVLGGYLPTAPIHGAANTVGKIMGFFDGEKVDTEEEREKLVAGSPLRGLAPGHGSYRVGQRLRGSAEESKEHGAKHGIANLIAEQLGGATAALPISALGAALGVMLSGNPIGMLTGAGLGAVLPTGVGSLLAAIKKRRTAEEQADIDDNASRALLKYLVPGMSTYDMFKRYGRSKDWEKKKTPDEESD